jgi:drug/metabolite transporter (DMT)-like permease
MMDFLMRAAIWGASFMFIRIGAVEFGVPPTAGLRRAIAALFLLPIVLYWGQVDSLKQHRRRTLVVGVLNSAIPFACYTYALLSITTGLSSILNAAVPLFGAVIAWVWLKDRPHGSCILGLAVGFAGVALLASLCYGIAASFTKLYMVGVPPLVSAAGSQLSAAVVLVPQAAWTWPDHAVSTHVWAAIAALGVICTGVAYILHFRIIESADPAKALSAIFAIPMFAVLYGVVLLGETVTPWMLVCIAVIIMGTSLSTALVKFSRK